MVKSKRTTYFYFGSVSLILLTIIYVFHVVQVMKGYIKWGFSYEGFILFLFPSLLLFILAQKFIRDSKIIIVDKELGSISFTNLLFRTKRIYQYEDLDGYVTGRFISGNNRTLTKVVWIVKNGIMQDRINADYVNNINDIEKELKELKYLGYQSITKIKRIKLIFKKLKID